MIEFKNMKSHWNVGDTVSLWYVDFKLLYRVKDIEVIDIPIEEVRTTSRVEDFTNTDTWNWHATNAKGTNIRSSSFRHSDMFPLKAVKHDIDIGYPTQLLDNKFNGNYMDTRIIDGHHRFVYCYENKDKYPSIPCKVHHLEQMYPQDVDILEGLGPWEHSITLPDGITTKGAYINPEIKFALFKDKISFKNKNVLDLGCSDGWYCFKAIQDGATNVTGVDNEPNRSMRSKYLKGVFGYNNCSFELSSVEDYIDTTDKKFDTILMISILHWLQNTDAIMPKLYEMLNKQGEVIIENRGDSSKIPGTKPQRFPEGTIATMHSLGWILEKAKEAGFSTDIVNTREHNGSRQIIKLVKD